MFLGQAKLLKTVQNVLTVCVFISEGQVAEIENMAEKYVLMV